MESELVHGEGGNVARCMRDFQTGKLHLLEEWSAWQNLSSDNPKRRIHTSIQCFGSKQTQKIKGFQYNNYTHHLVFFSGTIS